MKADRYTKAVLTVIALALAIIAVPPVAPRARRRAGADHHPKYDVAIPKEWGKLVAYSNNNLLLEGSDKSLRVVDIEGKAPEYPKIKALIRWQ